MAPPRNIVDPPLTTPLPYDLMSVVQLRSTGDSHWMNGVTYQPWCDSDTALTYDECLTVTGAGAPPPPNPKTKTSSLVMRGATPFTVYTEIECSPVGTDLMKVASDTLDQLASRDVETAIWTGVADGHTIAFPHLAADAEVRDDNDILLQTAATVVTGAGAPHDITCGLGLIEQALAECYGRQGIIHVPRKVLPVMAAHRLVKARGPQLLTENNNIVAVGSGYDGTGPAGETPGDCDSWIYATGAMFMYAGPTRITNLVEAFDRSTNTVKMLAERTYVVGWDCCHLATHVSTTAL